MHRLITTSALVLLCLLPACSFQAQECCECMATKTLWGANCVTETNDNCVSGLSENPPDVSVISEWCRLDSNGYCQESCADVLYKN